MRNIKLGDVFLGLVLGLVFLIVFVCLLTPEKDKNGNYTQPYKYWTSAAYYKANF